MLQRRLQAVVYFSRGPLPTKKRNGTSWHDLGGHIFWSFPTEESAARSTDSDLFLFFFKLQLFGTTPLGPWGNAGDCADFSFLVFGACSLCMNSSTPPVRNVRNKNSDCEIGTRCQMARRLPRKDCLQVLSKFSHGTPQNPHSSGISMESEVPGCSLIGTSPWTRNTDRFKASKTEKPYGLWLTSLTSLCFCHLPSAFPPPFL